MRYVFLFSFSAFGNSQAIHVLLVHLVRDCRPDIVKFVHFGRARGLSYVQLVHLREICRQPGCRPNIRDLKRKDENLDE